MPVRTPTRLLALLLTCTGVSPLLACDGDPDRPDASAEPMGEPAELGGACDVTPVATFDVVGGVAPNVVGFDQYGEEVSLYDDLCDKHVLIIRAGFDCGACNDGAAGHGELYEEFRDRGLVVVTYLSDLTKTIGVDEQNIWANAYGLAHPVIGDDQQLVSEPLWPGKTGRPMHKLLGPGAVILHQDPTHDDVRALFE